MIATKSSFVLRTPFSNSLTAAQCVKEARLLWNRLPAKGIGGGRNRANAPLLLGNHKTNRRGDGMEFHQLRPYQQGDPIPFIDWRASARTSHQILVREKNLEGQKRTSFVMDASSSMMIHGMKNSKYHRAILLGLTLAIHIQKREQGSILFKPDGRAQHSEKMAHHLLTHHAENTIPLAEMIALHPQKTRLILMSDGFITQHEWQKIFRIIRLKKMNGIVILILNEDEMTFPFEGRILFHDENDTSPLAINSASIHKNSYLHALKDHHLWIRNHARKASMGHVIHNAKDDPIGITLALTSYLDGMS